MTKLPVKLIWKLNTLLQSLQCLWQTAILGIVAYANYLSYYQDRSFNFILSEILALFLPTISVNYTQYFDSLWGFLIIMHGTIGKTLMNSKEMQIITTDFESKLYFQKESCLIWFGLSFCFRTHNDFPFNLSEGSIQFKINLIRLVIYKCTTTNVNTLQYSN